MDFLFDSVPRLIRELKSRMNILKLTSGDTRPRPIDTMTYPDELRLVDNCDLFVAVLPFAAERCLEELLRRINAGKQTLACFQTGDGLSFNAVDKLLTDAKHPALRDNDHIEIIWFLQVEEIVSHIEHYCKTKLGLAAVI